MTRGPSVLLLIVGLIALTLGARISTTHGMSAGIILLVIGLGCLLFVPARLYGAAMQPLLRGLLPLTYLIALSAWMVFLGGRVLLTGLTDAVLLSAVAFVSAAIAMVYAGFVAYGVYLGFRRESVRR
jgi:hypothetical protein